MNPSTEDSSLGDDRTVDTKVTQDILTHNVVIELYNAKFVVKKGTTKDELMEKPLREIMECQLA